ncbi:hypothetical protein F8606_19395 [Salmonella enterica]|uniref:Uncharacterized protein n=1 Tax=Salmonella diarizonae TaxID=59204 RepID=A0A5Y1YF93_SALDZ|nr:hypothetical protein [Salmonella enterica subsp. diarizonae]ECZ8127214.1 hypothetical protein [Salmonella enterica]EEG5324664.1 hypothetical protein [Salmonella enterica]HAF1611135.1 hypothetical protein [Salmonella enterica]
MPLSGRAGKARAPAALKGDALTRRPLHYAAELRRFYVPLLYGELFCLPLSSFCFSSSWYCSRFCCCSGRPLRGGLS